MLGPAPQTGGSADLDALWTELAAHWPGYYVTSIVPSTSVGSRDREGGYVPDKGWFRATSCGSWCVTVESDGWETDRDRYYQWGSSIKAAADRLADRMEKVRTSPHSVALGIPHYDEVTRDASIFRAACHACVTEWEACGRPYGLELS